MKNYVKPIVIANSELAEGVYAASGDCMHADVRIFQRDGDGTHRGEIKYWHTAHMDHCNTGSKIVVRFDVPFNVTDSSSYIVTNNGTTAITFNIANALHSDGDCQTVFNFVGKPVSGSFAEVIDWDISDEGFRDYDCEHVKRN